MKNRTFLLSATLVALIPLAATQQDNLIARWFGLSQSVEAQAASLTITHDGGQVYLAEQGAINWSSNTCYANHFFPIGNGHCEGSSFSPGDNVSATKLCNMKGYQNGQTFGSEKWSSCGDNTLIYWDGSTWRTKNGCSPNAHLGFNGGITCTNPFTQCNDGVDNDGDGKVDLNDPGCNGASDNDESNNPQCADGIDNDNDGKTDYPSDPGCSSASDNDEYNAPPACTATRYATVIAQRSSGDSGSDVILGAPDGNTTDFDSQGSAYGFVAVGFDPSLTIVDGSGDDIRLHLRDFSTTSQGGGAEDETFTLLASQDGVNYVSLGTRSPSGPSVGQPTTFGFDLAGKLPWAKFVKVQNERIANHDDEGPDIDAVEIVNANCTGSSSSSSVPQPQCSDGIDNDGDGRTDYPSDAGCNGPSDNSEASPSVDLKINGQDGTVSVTAGQTVTLSWTSVDVQRCDTGTSNMPGWGQYESLPTSGSRQVTVTQTGTYGIHCALTQTSNMVVQDSVGANVTQSSSSYSSSTSSSPNSCQNAQNVLHSIYTVASGGSDPYGLNQNNVTAYCHPGDMLLSGAGTGPSCDSTQASCGRIAYNEGNTAAISGSQKGWTTGIDLGGDATYDTVRTEATCAPSSASQYFTTYTRTTGGTDLYSLDQQNTTAFCDVGDIAIHGGGSAPFCDANNPGCNKVQYLESNRKIVSGNREGWQVHYDLGGNAVYDTVQTTVVCLKKTPIFDQYLKVYTVENQGNNVYDLNQNKVSAFCNAGDVAIGGGGSAPYCDTTDPACGKIQYLEGNKKVTSGGLQGWSTAIDLGGDAIYDTQRVEVTCLGLANSCSAGSSSTSSSSSSASTQGWQCSNGVDDDGDGLVDINDPGCHTDRNRFNPLSYNPYGNEFDNNRSFTCQDGIDNNNNGLIDAQDPICHSDGNPNNPGSYTPNGNEGYGSSSSSSSSSQGTFQCNDGADNDGDSLTDGNDPGCHTDYNRFNPQSYNPYDNNESDRKGTCSDGVDNNGNGLIDAQDPVCHTDGNPNNNGSFDPNRDETGGGGQGNACIIIKTDAEDEDGKDYKRDLPDFTVALDGGVRTVRIDDDGDARFDNVSSGTHYVTMYLDNDWELDSISPSNGSVTLTDGSGCKTVTFHIEKTDDDDDGDDAEVKVRKTASSGEVFPGGTVEYVITIENTGDTDLENLVVEDRLPSDVTVLNDGDADEKNGNTLTWEIDVDEDETVTIRYTVAIPTWAYPGQVIRNDVRVVSDDDDYDIDEDASAYVTVIGSLPQTGITGMVTGASAYLTPVKQAAASSSGMGTAAAAAATVLSGIGGGIAFGRKFLGM